MSEMTEIIIGDEWMIARMDALNWRVRQKREIEKGKRAGETAWVDLDAFFPRPELAARYVYDHMGGNDGKKELREFIKAMNANRDAILKAVS